MTGRPTREALARLSAYLDGESGPSERARVERELAADPALRQALDDARRLSRGLSVDDADRDAARSIRAALRQRLAAPSTGRAPLRRTSRRTWLPIAAGAAVLVAVALAFVLPVGWPGWQRGGAVQEGAVVEQYRLALDALSQGEP